MAVDGHGLSEEDLALLTEEERAGLADDDGNDGEDEGDDGSDAGDGTGAEGDDASQSDDDGAAGKVNDADEDADTAGNAAEAEDEDDDAAPAPVATGDRLDPASVKARIEEISTKKDELDAKLDDGEITTKEYRVELEKLSGEQNKLSSDLARQEDADAAVVSRWYADVNKFMDKNPELKANETRLASFDAVVRRVTGDPENASLSNMKQLQKARDIWREEMGFNEKPDTAAKDKDGDKTGAKAKPKSKPVLPPTLHNVPAADINDADDGKYSHLDALLNAGRTIEYEDALGRMSEAEQQDYLSRA